tara:strand:+ start:59970 stop:60212 length:243 start_codon:yes stop_codon:yes gene_type:complete
VVKGTVSISIEDFQSLIDAKSVAAEVENKFILATKELQVFLSFLASRTDLDKYVDEFNRQSKTSKIVFEGTFAKIEMRDV